MAIKLIFSLFFLLFFVGVETTGFVFAEEKNINFFLDKAWYEPRDIIQITGWVNNVNSTEIQIEIINPDDVVIVHQRILLEEIHEIDHQIAIFGREWNESGFYQIKISHVGESETRLFALGNFDPKIFEPQISLDREIYSWTDTVKIMIISPNDNENFHQIDKIKIKISTRAGTLPSYTLEETGKSDGVFSGIITLTGYSDFDLNQDGRPSNVRGYTGGPGPDEGHLEANPSDSLRITYSTPFYDETIEKKTPIQFQKAIVQWSDLPIYTDEKALARVIDPDMRLSPQVTDDIKVLIKSSSQKFSKQYILKETELNSGIFEGKIPLDSKNFGGGVYAPAGSIVSIWYEDTTLPSSYLEKKLNIIATATVLGIEIEERQPPSIPPWVKNTAEWWSESSLKDDGFLRGIQYLIDKGIITYKESKPDPNKLPFVPDWIKKSARWWSQGLISDEEFVKGIEHLMKLGIIRV